MSAQLHNGPRITVEGALVSNPLDASPTYTDMTEGLRSCLIRRGRSHELARMQAGITSLVFRNSDDRWNRWNTASPYYGNLFSAEDADFETGVSGWAGVTNCTVAQSAAYAGHGTYSMQVTATASGAFSFVGPSTNRLPVIAGKVYTPLLNIRALEHTATFTLTVRFFDALSGGSLVGTAVGGGPTVTPGAFTQQGGAPVTAPVGAVGADLLLTATATSASDHFYVDTAQLAAGTSTTWGPGGRGGNLQPMLKMRVSAQWNLLSANQASVETDTGGLLAQTNCSISRSISQSSDGVASLALTSTASGTMSAQTTAVAGIAPQQTYTFVARFRAATSARSCRLIVLWLNSAGSQIASSTSSSTADTTSGWTTVSHNATAPTGAVSFSLVFSVLSTSGASEVHYVDCAGAFPGANVSLWVGGGPNYLFTGYVESIEHSWPSPNYAETTVTLVDGFKVLSLAKAARTTYFDAVMAKSPDGYWRFDDVGTGNVVNGVITAADSSGNAADGAYKGSPAGFQQTGVLPAEIGGAVDLGTRSGWVEMPIGPCPSGTGNWSVILWVTLRNLAANSPVDKLWHVVDVGSQHVEINVQTNGKVRFWVSDGTNGGYVDSNVEIPVYGAVMVTAVKSGTTGPGNWKLYFGKTDVSGATSTDGSGNVSVTSNAMLVGGRTGSPNVAAIDGVVDEHAIIPSALSGADVTTIYDASYGLASSSLAGARIGKLLDIAGIPSADRSLDAGQYLMQPVKGQLYQQSPLPLILDYVDSEGYPAAFFFAGNGDAVFQDNAHSTPASSGTFGDGVSELKVAVGGAPTADDSDLWTTVVCQADDGAAKSATDADAAARYVDRTLSRTGLRNADDDDVQTLADDLLARYKTPVERVKGLALLPHRDPGNLFPHALGREINDRILYNRANFSGDGSGLALDLRIEGITHDFDASSWKTTWMAVPT